MKIQPLDDRVLVKILEEEEKTRGGIIIPDTAKEKPRMGKVVEVGTDEDLKKIIKSGDKIIFAKYGGEEIEFDNNQYTILSRNDILAVLKD
ncbi:10 kDa chaperonin [bacterium BMS3Abin05]|nr:10 kDa chaperonin [bacterium BMS3Abin05]GBE28968.1 10 kDa chaperonin [bacterium BMS3Bbin03]HDL78638.1 co-chaperone GroES [Bacteroidota bacterium]